MQKRTSGKSDLEVSAIGLGCIVVLMWVLLVPGTAWGQPIPSAVMIRVEDGQGGPRSGVWATEQPEGGSRVAWLPTGWCFPVVDSRADRLCLEYQPGCRGWVDAGAVKTADPGRLQSQYFRAWYGLTPGYDRPGGKVVVRFPHWYHLGAGELVYQQTRPWLKVHCGPEAQQYFVPVEERDGHPLVTDTGPLPSPGVDGVYRGENHIYWQVVDPDPQGLNGRLSPDFPREYSHEKVWPRPWPQSDPANWPVVQVFPAGTILESKVYGPGNLTAGSKNRYQGSWLMVSRLDRPEFALCAGRLVM